MTALSSSRLLIRSLECVARGAATELLAGSISMCNKQNYLTLAKGFRVGQGEVPSGGTVQFSSPQFGSGGWDRNGYGDGDGDPSDRHRHRI